MSFRTRPYRPSPSCLGSCPRSLVYWALNYPQGEDVYTEFRAARGTAIHKYLPELLEILKPKLLVDGRKIVSYNILGHEVPTTLDCGGIIVDGTADLLLEVEYEKDDVPIRKETWDLKNYARVPSEPYEGNKLQLQLYIESLGCDRGVLLYCPDSGFPETRVVQRDPGIREVAAKFFNQVSESVDRRSFPERLAYNSQQCGYCSYWQECWGGLWEEIKLIKKFQVDIAQENRKGVSEEIAETIKHRKGVLKELKNLKDEADDIQDQLMRAFSEEGTDVLEAPGGETLRLSKVNKKDGGFYYKITSKEEG